MGRSGKETNAEKFTAPAARIWDAIPTDAQKTLLENAWCSRCRHEVILKDFSGSVKAGNVVLVGTCSECGGAASRIVEVKPNRDKTLTVVMGKPKLTLDQAPIEMALLDKEFKALSRREHQLMMKADEGTITQIEQKELDKSSRKAIDQVLLKMFDLTNRLAP